MSGNGHRTEHRTEELRRDLEETRTEMQRTIRSLQEAVSPEAFARLAVDYFKDGPGELTKNLGRAIRDNPVPFVLTGIGLGWLAVATSREPRPARPRHYLAPPPVPGAGTAHLTGVVSSETPDALIIGEGDTSTGSKAASRVRHAAESVKHGAGSAAQSVKHGATSAAQSVKSGAATIASSARGTARSVQRVAHEVGSTARATAHAVSETAHNASTRVREGASELRESIRERSRQARIQAERARTRAAETHQERPLILGLIGIAVGAIVGALAPRTRREDRLLGARSDELKRTLRREAEKVATTGMEKATELVGEYGEKTAEIVRSKSEQLREKAGDGSSSRSLSGTASRTHTPSDQPPQVRPTAAAGGPVVADSPLNRPTSGQPVTGVSTPSTRPSDPARTSSATSPGFPRRSPSTASSQSPLERDDTEKKDKNGTNEPSDYPKPSR